jgi:pSer/pThr/pTyr-binding forkhead associated (FHA) protein
LSKRQIDVVVKRAGYQDRRVAFGLGVVHFGRAEDNDLVLADIGVSRRHARLVVNANGVFVEDLGSGNGTFFDGNRINRQPVQNGDEVVIDPFSLKFVMPEQDEDLDDGLTSDLEDVEDDDTAEVPIAPPVHPAFEDETNHRGTLVTLQGQRLAPSYSIRGTGLSIGRSEARDVILFDPAASRNHALLEPVGGSIWLRDHGSGNGTFVNGLRVREQCLRGGDRIRVGSTEFRFEVLTSPHPEPPTMPPSDNLAEMARVARAEGRIPLPGAAVERPPPPGPVQGSRVVMFAALASFMVVAMMILGGLLVMYVIEPQMKAGSEAFSPPGVRVPAESADVFANHLELGFAAFDEGQFLVAASQYYTALKLAPGHPQAERMAHVSCEYLALDTLRAGIVLQGLSQSEKKDRQSKAVRLAKNAVRGRASVDEARFALMEVLVFMPDDSRSKGLLEQLKGK